MRTSNAMRSRGPLSISTRGNSMNSPQECRDADYERRLKQAYPIHPELFDRLYEDWSTLLRFQRTRGVLRLMAAVIHSLWQKGDRSPLILPSLVPIDDPRVQSELTSYLPDRWVPIIESDVDGANSLPLRMDGQFSNLGKLNACRRVARNRLPRVRPAEGRSPQGHGRPPREAGMCPPWGVARDLRGRTAPTGE